MKSKYNKFMVVWVYGDRPSETNTSNFRCVYPAKAFAKKGYGSALMPTNLFEQNTPEVIEACSKASVIVVERNLFGNTLTQMMYWLVRGKVVIANFDDNYEVMESTNPAYNYWINGSVHMDYEGKAQPVNIFPHPMWQFKVGLKICHGQTVPSKELMKYYGKYSPTYLVRNYFETENYINIPKEERDYFTIGWGGSLSHQQSFRDSGIIKALQNVCQVRDNVKIMVCGDKNVSDLLGIPEDKIVFQPYVPPDQWGRTLATKFDIGLAPLCGEYDNYRSWIKPVEYMLVKIPWIASNSASYKDIKDYGNLIENSESNWTESILRVLDNYQNEKEFASGKPYEFALRQDINRNVERIANTYRNIAKKHANIDLY
jgi:glycosyltransferase involved in cell wall biosynthesis